MGAKQSYGEVINVGSNREISMIDLANMIKTNLATDTDINLVPYEQIYPDGGFEDMRRRVPSIEKIYKLIKWEPKSTLEEIVKEVIKFQKVIQNQ